MQGTDPAPCLADAVGIAAFGRMLELRACKEGFSQIKKITQLFGRRHNKHSRVAP